MLVGIIRQYSIFVEFIWLVKLAVNLITNVPYLNSNFSNILIIIKYKLVIKIFILNFFLCLNIFGCKIFAIANLMSLILITILIIVIDVIMRKESTFFCKNVYFFYYLKLPPYKFCFIILNKEVVSAVKLWLDLDSSLY